MTGGAPRAVLFDWDNTLVDNWDAVLGALNAALAAMGHQPWTRAESRQRATRSLRDTFPSLFGERWTEARDIFYAHFTANHLETLRPLPGAGDLLQHLSEAAEVVSVVSNKRGDLLRREAQHLGWCRHFWRIVGADDAESDKPDAAAVALALSESGLSPGPEVWFVGDNAVDVRCAHISGCIAVLVGDSDKTAASEERPDIRVANLLELVKLVREA